MDADAGVRFGEHVVLRIHPLLQKHDTLGLRLLLGLGRFCLRKLLLGKGSKEERESGLLGNHVLLSQPVSWARNCRPALKVSATPLWPYSDVHLRKCESAKY